MSAGAVKAGGVFVEIGADPTKFFSALNKVNKSLSRMGGSLVSGGGRLAAAGAGMAAPIIAAVQQGTRFESTLLNIRASTGATAGEIDKIRTSAMDMSKALGVGPTEAAGGMLELLKAGMSLDSVLGGAGKTAMEFAKVGEMDVAQAAVVMSDAMNVFKVSSDVAANALSSAADASSTSIAQMSEAFSMSSAVAGLAGQSIEDLSAMLAILANNGVKGSDAGTSVKTMLMRLMAPADDAVGALDQLGLSVSSFRGADGQMKPMVDIIGRLSQAMGGLDQAAKDDMFRRIFGADAIRAASILVSEGVDGFDTMREAMASALPVGEKYKILMSGLAGGGMAVLAAMQRLAIAISSAVAPALASVVPFITGFIDGLTDFASKNKEAVAGFAKFAVAAIGIGGAMTGLGISLQVTSFGFAGIGRAAAFALSPLTMLIGAASGVGKSFTLALPATAKLAGAISTSMLTASASVMSFASAAGTSLAGFASSSATSLAGFAASSVAGFARMSTAGLAAAQAMFPVFFTGFNRGIAAGAGFFSATLRGLNGVVMASSGLRAAMSAVAGSGMAKFVTDIVGGLTLTYKSFVWWATGASARMAQYAANIYMAAAATVTNAVRIGAAWVASALPGIAAFATAAAAVLSQYVGSVVMAGVASVTNAVRSGAAWVASALPGVLTFVGGAVAGIASYIGAAAMAVATSVASAAAVAAAWLAPLAPFLLLAAAAVGVGVAVKQFGGQIGNALGGVGAMARSAGTAITETLGGAVRDGIVVFGDLATTATTTFDGVYAAVAEGDLSGAIDILMLGLTAGWLRGVEALMGYVDPWVAAFQDVFTDLGAAIYVAWDTTFVNVGNVFNTFGAILQGSFDNVINGVLASWDALSAGIQKSWNYIQSFFTAGFDLEAENKKVDDKMSAQAQARSLARPGVKGRLEAAGVVNDKATADLGVRTKGVMDDAQATKDGRQDTNRQRAAERRAGVEAAEGKLNSLVSGKQDTRVKNSQVDDLMSQIQGASKMSDIAGVGSLSDQFMTLRDMGRLTSDQEEMLSNALDKSQEKLTGTRDSKSAGGMVDPAGMQDNLAAAAKSAEVVGTFSSNLGGMGFGSNLDQLQLAALNKIAENTKNNEEGAIAA